METGMFMQTIYTKTMYTKFIIREYSFLVGRQFRDNLVIRCK